MKLLSDRPDATDVHAAFGSAHDLLIERRALYRLAVELMAPEAVPTDDRLDNPVFRFRVGEALAGREPFDRGADDGLDDITIELESARLGLIGGRTANERLAEALRLVHAQCDLPGEPPRLLTEADVESFGRARRTVEAGIAKVREASPRVADDLLPHAYLLGVLDPATSGGLVSASSRLFPGLILIDAPAGPYDVAEALIHEGAHQKFFDLAITRDFLGDDVSNDEIFRPSWSGAKWPVEQVVAAFHAYACLAQFAEDVFDRGEARLLGPDSLLPAAREREREIGRWILDHEHLLRFDGRWFVRRFLQESPPEQSYRSPGPQEADGVYEFDAGVRVVRIPDTGRILLGRQGRLVELSWLAVRAAGLLDRLGEGVLMPSELPAQEASALTGLVTAGFVRRVSPL